MDGGGAGKGRQRWHVVMVEAGLGNHRWARRNLCVRKWRVFLPECLEHVQCGRAVQVRRGPLFPGYLFVCFDPAVAAWRDINRTPGVISGGAVLTGCDETPLAVPEGFVEALEWDMAEGGGVIRLGEV